MVGTIPYRIDGGNIKSGDGGRRGRGGGRGGDGGGVGGRVRDVRFYDLMKSENGQ